ncbi:hypothetical protein [Sediminitomix flava]|uniref:VLRF1 domain-containing protein n=1 Tax=Sediminitomix flava TaxID=379075 RepID=A0A315ZGS5_SEDFL|nr:hypothetical protein [Sediminitomix flava]PWJ44058.1 hypothetical protein BC781_101408 [Sediminitomix flava]
MEQLSRNIPNQLAVNLAHKLTSSDDFPFEYDHEKHRLIFNEDLSFRLPIGTTLGNEKKLKYVFILIQTESCSIGYYEGADLVSHKVYGTYGVRKKQGKSQIKYLKTRGKSKAGSRVRLGNTISFFEKINTRLQEHFKENQIDRIVFSCSKILLPYLFGSKVNCPFDKKDERIYKIPKHINHANHEEMIKLHKELQRGEFIYKSDQEEFVESLIQLGS